MIRKIRSFIVRDKKGTAAIEFGILGPVFIVLMVGIMEIGYYVFTTSSAQRAVDKAVYDLRTGHVYNVVNAEQISIEEWYRKRICENVLLTNCKEKIEISVEQYGSDLGSFWNSDDAGELSAGSAGILMRVEVIFEMPSFMFTTFVFGENATELETGFTFMTEPYA